MSIVKRSVVALLASAAFAAPVMAQASFTYTTRGCIGSSSCTVGSGTSNPFTYTAGSNSTITYTGVNNVSTATTNANGYVALSDLGAFSFSTGGIQNGSTLNLAGNGSLTFKLWIDFTAPVVSGDPYTFTADLDGTLYENTTNGSISVVFNSPSDAAFTYLTGGSFRMFVNDRSTPNYNNWSYGHSYNTNSGYSYNYNSQTDTGTGSLTLTGAIDCSPSSSSRDGNTTYTATSSSGGQCVPPVRAGVDLQSTVPEPSTYLLMASGLAAVAAVSRRRRRTV